MPFKQSDWQAVLDQPKNLGLKAGGGTGIGKLLVACDASEKAFRQNNTRENANKLQNDLNSLVTQCDAVVKKHKSLFTSACAYLEKVKETAVALGTDLMAFRDWDQKKHSLSLSVDNWVKELKGAAKMDQLEQTWRIFRAHLRDQNRSYPTLAKYIEDVENFHFNSNGEFQSTKNQVVTLAQIFENHLNTLTWHSH